MTGQDFIFDVQQRLGESQSTTSAQQQFVYPKHVRWAADKLARDTWALYRHGVLDLMQGQLEYVFPPSMFRHEATNVADGAGNIYPLASITPESADSMFFNWRSNGQQIGNSNTTTSTFYQGIPAFYVAEGLKTIKLLPLPNYQVENGLIISGYFGIDDWWDMADDCPLPPSYDEAISCGAAFRRCMEMQRTDATYVPLIRQYKDMFEELKRDLYRECIGANAARRGGMIPSRGSRMGAYSCGGWGWGC